MKEPYIIAELVNFLIFHPFIALLTLCKEFFKKEYPEKSKEII